MKKKWYQYIWWHSTFILLTIIGGYLDAYTYLTRGGVFANAQTGNLVLLGVNLANGDKFFIRYSFPIAAFVVGIFISDYLKEKSSQHKQFDGRLFILCIEMVTVFLVSIFEPNETSNAIVNIIISFITALQYGEFRKLRGQALATTMCSGMLRSATDYLYRFFRNRSDTEALKYLLLYFSMVACFAAGCIIGTWVTHCMGYHSGIVCGLIFLLAICSYWKDGHIERRTRMVIRE